MLINNYLNHSTKSLYPFMIEFRIKIFASELGPFSTDYQLRDALSPGTTNSSLILALGPPSTAYLGICRGWRFGAFFITCFININHGNIRLFIHLRAPLPYRRVTAKVPSRHEQGRLIRVYKTNW